MQTEQVGRIVNLDRDMNFERHPPICSRCVMLEQAIREHQRAHEAAGSFVEEATANLELWKVVGL